MNGWLPKLVGNNVLANVVMIAIIAGGLFSAASLRRESMPEISLHAIQIRIAYPGADPQEVEEGVARRLEAAIDGLKGIKQYHTSSYEGVAYAEVELIEGFSIERMMTRLRNAVDSIHTFPRGVEPASYTELGIQGDDGEDVISLAIWGDAPERQLKVLAEGIRNDLQRLPEISTIFVGDTRGYEIDIQISKERLQQYGLTLDDVSQAIASSSMNLSTGTIRADGEEIQLRALGRRYDGRELAGIVVKATHGGDVITLEKIAEIDDGFTETGAYGTFNGEPCVLIEVYKGENEDAIAIAESVKAYAREKSVDLPAGLHLSPCFDETEFIGGQLSLLLRNGAMGLALVLVTLLIFLTTRLAFWVSMGIPISLCGALIAMAMWGITINQISLMTFIIVLGIIVDDAIVVGESIFHHRQQGKSPLRASVDGVREVGPPVIAAVFTTVAAFLPLAFVPGVIGSVMALMPVIVISALLISLVECLFLLPAHLNHLPEIATKENTSRFERVRGKLSGSLDTLANRYYAPIVRLATRHRYTSLCVAVGLLCVAIGAVGGGFVRVVFWPPVDGDVMAASVEFPEGTPAEITRKAIQQTREGLLRVAEQTETVSGEPLIKNMHTRVFDQSQHMGRVFVEMISASKRGIHSQDISAAWEKEVGIIPGAIRQSFFKSEISAGGDPIAIWLLAKDMGHLRDAAEKLKAKLKTYDGVYQISDDMRLGKTELQLRLKPEAHALGLSLEDVARQVQGGYYGHEALRIQRGREDVRVRVRFTEDERASMDELGDMRIVTPQGHRVPLFSVVEGHYEQGFAAIKGTDGMRRAIVFAACDVNVTTPGEVLADLEKSYLDTLVAGYPSMEWTIRGAAEENAQTLGGLQRGFVVAILGIFVIMAAVFRSYAQPFVILLIVPFGMIGAIAGHYLVGIPITFLSMFGIVAMAGVVVNDAIVLTERVNGFLSEGMSFRNAICQGGLRRFRPILLTSVSTVAGLMPLILEKDLQAQMVIPMAVSIAAGVGFATFLNLLLLPCLLAILNDARRAAHHLRRREWPTAEMVEPATNRRTDEETYPDGQTQLA